MIILRLQGGMGNQMFQYAAAKSVALRLGVELALDLGWYHSGTRKQGRVYSLGCFPNIKDRAASFRDVFSLAPWQAFENVLERKRPIRFLYKNFLYKLLEKAVLLSSDGNQDADRIKDLFSYLSPIHRSRIYKQTQRHWTPDLEALMDDTYMIGYWESEKFFRTHQADIRHIFEWSPETLESEMGKEIRSQCSVAVHVRRGDKLKTPGFLSTGVKYIKDAVLACLARLHHPCFFVFSDDIAWCKENLPKLCDARWIFVEGAEDNDAYKDLCLMASCRHNIVGTSTFSWWGAWLNRNPQRFVVAPHPSLWFSGVLNDQETSDLLCEDWVVLR